MTSLVHKFAKTGLLAAGLLGASAVASEAKCWVKDDATGKTSMREFSGNSAQKIWPYCKKFINVEREKKQILNGTFGMDCHGSVSCNIRGRIVNGRIVQDELSMDGKTVIINTPTTNRNTVRTEVEQPRKKTVTESYAKTHTRATTQTNTGLKVETGTKVVTSHKPTVTIRQDSGWSHFDALVADCERYSRTGWFARAETAKPSCKR